ncbi:hypothetical protein PM10SUCC1_28920 [Propionigenium maris DSM 9537]|uniref:Uncharacterized protein n=1 Tax=Propionigenium maris DSM 9537 TaxID=1123000 RepID=A0A9W6LP67_9FUSO|nr:hypothetical protein [Propionigenium maris]GLI57378.1 hypothetical protein PM10SUCC1_28920 [Propionigenium maris DSM 9537]
MFGTHTILILMGSLLLLIGIAGGGISIKEIKIPKVNNLSRTLSFIMGIGCIIGGIYIENLNSTSSKEAKDPVRERVARPAETATNVQTASTSEEEPVIEREEVCRFYTEDEAYLVWISVEPDRIRRGEEATLTWGILPDEYSRIISPEETTIYILRGVNGNGEIIIEEETQLYVE